MYPPSPPSARLKLQKTTCSFSILVRREEPAHHLAPVVRLPHHWPCAEMTTRVRLSGRRRAEPFGTLRVGLLCELRLEAGEWPEVEREKKKGRTAPPPPPPFRTSLRRCRPAAPPLRSCGFPSAHRSPPAREYQQPASGPGKCRRASLTSNKASTSLSESPTYSTRWKHARTHTVSCASVCACAARLFVRAMVRCWAGRAAPRADIQCIAACPAPRPPATSFAPWRAWSPRRRPTDATTTTTTQGVSGRCERRRRGRPYAHAHP